ncbi:MAG: hypothetical protein WBH56_09160 [Bacteroidota bacterium]
MTIFASSPTRLALPLLIGMLPLAAGTSRAQEPDSLAEIRRQIEVLAEELERMKLGEVADLPPVSDQGLGPAASRVYSLRKPGVSLAGYGELVYENFSNTRDDQTESRKKDKIDYLRAVVYFGYRFNEWILFNSEIEFEHASTGKGGEVSVEFGYLDLMLSDWITIRSGMVLIPIGIINERHEPTTFFGTVRPFVERYLIPATWRGIGAGATGNLPADFTYRLYLVESLDASGYSSSDGIRGGRQKGAKALAEDFGITGRLEYSPIPGASLAASLFAGNTGQGATDSLGTISAFTLVASAHAELAWRGFEIRVLYAANTVDQADRVSQLVNETVGSRMNGWYITGGYDVMSHLAPASMHSLIPYVQYEEYNTQSSVPSGFTADPTNDRRTLTLGLMYKPHPDVAFKADYRNNWNAAGTAVNQWNIAANYMF